MHPPLGTDLARNPGMCPAWESNLRHFGLQANTQSTEPRQPGLEQFHFDDTDIMEEQLSPTPLLKKKKRKKIGVTPWILPVSS